MLKKELGYSEIEGGDIIIPEQINAGLYTGSVMFDKKPWGNKFINNRVYPDAVSYASQFYAPHHIPSYNRPGNNTVNSSLFTKYNESLYNFSCHNN